VGNEPDQARRVYPRAGSTTSGGLRRVGRGLEILLAAAAAITAAGTAHAAASREPADPAARYRQCIADVAHDPFATLNEARAWVSAGGGDAARHCAAVADLALGRAREAAGELEALAELPTTPEARRQALLAQAGEAWMRAGSPDRAAAAFGHALARQPLDSVLLVDRALAYVDLDRLEEALADLSQAIEAEPLTTEAYVLRANVLRRTERFDRAAADLNTALTLDAHNPDALLERGLLRQQAGDAAGAAEDWSRVLTLAPDSAAADMARRQMAKAAGG
jgi:tetratricopeptide (TPR) repeat protein